MIKSPIWKDINFNSSDSEFQYFIFNSDDGTVHQGYTIRMPGNTGVTVNVNTRVEEYIRPDFDEDIRDVENEVVQNSKAYKEYQLRDSSASLQESYGFLYDWSYDDSWTGQTEHFMTKPINGHIDPRMKTMCSIYNTGETDFDWTIEYDIFIKASTNKLVLGVPGAPETIDIMCNDGWEITSMPSWLYANQTTGSGSYSSVTPTTVTFTADPNPNETDRTGEVVFTHSEGSMTIPVKQYGIVLIVNPTYVRFPITGGTKELEIKYNYQFTRSSSIDWISYGGDEYIALDGKNNIRTMRTTLTSTSGTTDKYGEILFQQDNVSRIVRVQKDGYNIEIQPTSLAFPATGGSKTVSVTANTAWSLYSLPSWITSSQSTGSTMSSGVTTITFTAGPNNGAISKSDNIVFHYGTDGTRNVMATQDTTLSVVPVQLVFDVTGGSRTITVKSSGQFGISGSTSSKLSFSRTSGSGTMQVTVNCTAMEDITQFGHYSFVVYNQYKAVTVNVEQGQSLSGTVLHTTYIAQEYPYNSTLLYSLAWGTPVFEYLSIDNGPAVYVGNKSTYSATGLTPGIHTVDYTVTEIPSSSPYSYLFSGTTLYTLELDEGTGGALEPLSALHLTYVDSGNAQRVNIELCPELNELVTHNGLSALTLGSCYEINQPIYLPSSTTSVQFYEHRATTIVTMPNKYDKNQPGPFIDIPGFYGESSLIANDGRAIVDDWKDYSGSSYVVIGKQLKYVATGGITAYTIPTGIDYIGPISLAETGIQKVTIPEGVKEIFGSCFLHSNVSEFNIPSSVTAVTHPIENCEWWVRQSGPLCIQDNWLVGLKSFTGTRFVVPEGVIGMCGTFNDYENQYEGYYGSEIHTVLSAVTEVVLPSTLKYLSGSNLFNPNWPSSQYGWNSLNTIYCYATTPPALNTSGGRYKPFQALRTYGTLHCPVGSNYNAWKNAGLSDRHWTIVYDL